MTPHLHQIWIGSEPPPRETAWIETIRRATCACRWQHTLWTWETLQTAYGHEPLAALFARALEILPGVVTATLISDYYRWRVLAESGGLYLDTDIELRADAWPVLPETPGLMGISEHFNRQRLCTCILWASPQTARLAADLAERHLLAALDPAGNHLREQYIDLVRRDKGGLVHHGIGPGWCRKNLTPALRQAGIPIDMLPETLAGHIQWGGNAALVHHGTAYWHEETDKTRLQALWDARAATARKQDFEASLPPWQRPRGRVLLPPRRNNPAASCAPPPEAHHPWPAPLILPGGTRRIIILSNITNGFNPGMVPLQAGDLVLHCNHARHAPSAMTISGTRHMLYVRHGRGRDPRGWHWYHDGSFDGYQRVHFIDDATMLAPFRWFRAYRARSQKSPTTGFILANMCRELYPGIPLILAGFAPGQNHGTPQWDGHDWQAEAAWYKEHNFHLIPPAPSAHRVLIIVCSSCYYHDRTLRAKNADGCYRARRACRLAWIRRLLPHTMQAVIIVGEGPPLREPHVVQLDAPDDYAHLPAKILAAMRWALANREWDYLVKVDDDTFVHPERLARYIDTLPRATPDIHGGASRPQDFNLCGGAGYILSRATVSAIVNDPAIPDIGLEDREICAAVLRRGGRIIKDARFNKDSTPAPTAQNDMITAHHMTPARMHRAFTNCYLL